MKERIIVSIAAAFYLILLGGAASTSTGELVDECDLPVAERSGGWFCYAPAR